MFEYEFEVVHHSPFQIISQQTLKKRKFRKKDISNIDLSSPLKLFRPAGDNPTGSVPESVDCLLVESETTGSMPVLDRDRLGSVDRLLAENRITSKWNVSHNSENYYDDYMNNYQQSENDDFHENDDCGVPEPEKHFFKEKASNLTKRRKEKENFDKKKMENEEKEAVIIGIKTEKSEKKNEGGKSKTKKMKDNDEIQSNALLKSNDVSQKFENFKNLDGLSHFSTEKFQLSSSKVEDVDDYKFKIKNSSRNEVKENKNFETFDIKQFTNSKENSEFYGNNSDFSKQIGRAHV